MKTLPLLLALPFLVACIPPAGMPDPVSAPAPLAEPRQQLRPQPPAPRPAPAASPTPAPVQRPAQPVTPSSTILAAWADASLSPGRWTYQPGRGAASRAWFGPANAPSFQVACEAGRSIAMTRTGAAPGGLTIRTSSTARTIPGAAGPQGLRAQIPAGDPLLDAIAFSRGRFAVEAPGAPPLVIPAWPELARVVEDCRR